MSGVLRGQRGLTLLELVVATALFALLSVVGWQVFGTVYKNYEHIAGKQRRLSTLTETYAILSEDMRALVPAAAMPKIRSDDDNQAQADNLTDTTKTDAMPAPAKANLAIHDGDALIRLLRFAPPDPSVYAQPALMQVSYYLDNGQLIRKHHDVMAETLVTGSVLLDDVEELTLQALMHEDALAGFEMRFVHQGVALTWLLSAPTIGGL